MYSIEDEVRRVRADRSWSLPADPALLHRVHVGARQRHRRRVGATAACAVLLAAGGVAGLATAVEPSPNHPNVIADRAPDRGREQDPSRAGTSPPISPSLPPPSPAANPAGGPVPAGMAAVSVTATAPNTLWVLGDARCAGRVCTSVARSLDGGRSFVGLPAPRDPVGSPGAGLGAVSDLRFGGSRDGFAYGGSLWSTHDGAGSWSRVDLGHPVEELAVTHGAAYATLRVGSDLQLWRSPNDRDAWSSVALPEPLGNVTPDVQVGSGMVFVLSGDRLFTGSGGDDFSVTPSPCSPDLGGEVSPTADGSLWAKCYGGMLAGLWRRGAPGEPFGAVHLKGGRPLPNSFRLAGVSADRAVVAVQERGLLVVTADGSVQPALVPYDGRDLLVTFLGFTTSRVGYAIVGEPKPALWRTEDGGLTWYDVPLG